MKNIHPELKEVTAHCTGCGHDFQTLSSVDEIRVQLCSQCHPFYSGVQKLVDTAGRVEKFERKYKKALEKKSKK